MDGLIKVYRQEGFKRLFSGATTATGRGVLMTIGQVAFYDQVFHFDLKSVFSFFFLDSNLLFYFNDFLHIDENLYI